MIYDVGWVAQVYVLANIAIGAGYLAVPALVLPHLPLRRITTVFGAIFFVGCFGSHLDMVWDVLGPHGQHPPVGAVAMAWHVMQAVGTWGFILYFRAELAAAKRLVDQVESGGNDGPA